MLLNAQRHLKPIFKFMITVAILLCIATYAFAQNQPRLINFQGKLTDQQGQALDGAYTVIFSLYATATGGTALWSERHENLSITGGLVNALLGSMQSLDAPQMVEFDSPRYLGITIDVDNNANSADPEMLPRQRIIPAIYAYNADTLDGNDSSFFTNPQTDAGRQGVVQDLYEGDTRLWDKYMAKDATNVNADTVDGYHATTSGGANNALPVINSGVTYSNLRAGYATSASSASSAGSCTSCTSASTCSNCTNATNCTNCSNASSVNGIQFSTYRGCCMSERPGSPDDAVCLIWPSNWSTDACRNLVCSITWKRWAVNNYTSSGGFSQVASGTCY